MIVLCHIVSLWFLRLVLHHSLHLISLHRRVAGRAACEQAMRLFMYRSCENCDFAQKLREFGYTGSTRDIVYHIIRRAIFVILHIPHPRAKLFTVFPIIIRDSPRRQSPALTRFPNNQLATVLSKLCLERRPLWFCRSATLEAATLIQASQRGLLLAMTQASKLHNKSRISSHKLLVCSHLQLVVGDDSSSNNVLPIFETTHWAQV